MFTLRLLLLAALTSIFASTLSAQIPTAAAMPIDDASISQVDAALDTSPDDSYFRRRDFTWSDSPARPNWGHLRLGRAQDSGDIYRSGYDYSMRLEFDESLGLYARQLEMTGARLFRLHAPRIEDFTVFGVTQLGATLRALSTKHTLITLGLGAVADNDEDELHTIGTEAVAMLEYYPLDPLMIEMSAGVHYMERGDVRADLWLSFGVEFWDEFSFFIAFRGLYGRGRGVNMITIGASLVFGWE